MVWDCGFAGLGEEQQRSLVRVKWDDRALSMAQDLCMNDILRLNRTSLRLGVMAFVRATASRSGGFTRDWLETGERGVCIFLFALRRRRPERIPRAPSRNGSGNGSGNGSASGIRSCRSS